MKRKFTEDETQMAKNIREISASPVIGKMQIKTTVMKFIFTLDMLTKAKNSDNTKCYLKPCKINGNSYRLVLRLYIGPTILENDMCVLSHV